MTTEKSETNENTTLAMAVCMKLAAAGAAAKYEARESREGLSLAVFKAADNTGGVVAVYDDGQHLDGVVEGLVLPTEGKRLAVNRAAKTIVRWEGDDDAINRKIRAVIDALGGGEAPAT